MSAVCVCQQVCFVQLGALIIYIHHAAAFQSRILNQYRVRSNINAIYSLVYIYTIWQVCANIILSACMIVTQPYAAHITQFAIMMATNRRANGSTGRSVMVAKRVEHKYIYMQYVFIHVYRYIYVHINNTHNILVARIFANAAFG